MESYCLKCKKSTKNTDPEISSSSNGRAIIISQFIEKEQFILDIKIIFVVLIHLMCN